MDIFEAPFLEGAGDEGASGSMQRSVDDAKVFLALDDGGIDRDAVHHVEVDLVDVFADDLDEVLIAFELDVADLHLVDFFDDGGVMRGQDLCAVVPVGFVAVILARVVAGGDVDTALTAQVTDGKRYFGRGAQVVEEVDLDAVGREDGCRNLGELAAVVAAVVAYDDGDLVAVLEALVQVVGQALGGGAYGIDVHAVAAGTHDAAQAACAEFQILVETVNQFGLVVAVQHTLYFGLGFCVVGRG